MIKQVDFAKAAIILALARPLYLIAHETGHALGALLTGGYVGEIHLELFGLRGSNYTTGGNCNLAVFVFGGYAFSLLVICIMLLASHRWEAGVLGISWSYFTILNVSTPGIGDTMSLALLGFGAYNYFVVGLSCVLFLVSVSIFLHGLPLSYPVPRGGHGACATVV
jgi:hypothetical protein